MILIRGNFILTKLVFFFVSLFVIGRVKVAGMKINSIEIRPINHRWKEIIGDFVELK